MWRITIQLLATMGCNVTYTYLLSFENMLVELLLQALISQIDT